MSNILNLKANRIIGDFEKGSITLKAWKNKSKITVEVIVVGCEIDYVKVCSYSQVAAIKFLFANSKLIHNKILGELFAALPDIKSKYYSSLPFIKNLDELENLIELSTIHIMASEKDDFAYVGFEFNCAWAEKHGIGVMMHKDRVIGIGQADKSSDIQATYADNGIDALITEKWGHYNKELK